jgi:prepilin-type N-terminal cleavage/methylation domain-containing protein
MFNDVMKKKNKKNRKGFSLVELIVVLVIMAILAAALVPTLIGYIKQSRQSNVKNEASSCLQAAQTIISSAYADSNGIYTGNGTGNQITFTFGTTGVSGTGDSKFLNEVVYLADLSGTGTVSGVKVNKDTLVVEEFSYTNTKKSITVSYDKGVYKVVNG